MLGDTHKTSKDLSDQSDTSLSHVVDNHSIIRADGSPSSITAVLIRIAHKQEKIIAEMGEAVRKGDSSTVFRLATILTSDSPPDK